MKGLASVFPRFALSRPVTVSMMLLAVLVMGLLSWQRIPVQLMPGGYDFPYLWVWMPYRDSTPRETERQIVQPVEDAIETLPGVRRLEARAGRNFARFEIELDQDVDMDEAWSGLTERLERARMRAGCDARRESQRHGEKANSAPGHGLSARREGRIRPDERARGSSPRSFPFTGIWYTCEGAVGDISPTAPPLLHRGGS